MALAKDRKPYDSHVGLVQACTYYGNVLGGSSAEVSSQYSPEGDTSEKVSGFVKNLAMSRSPSLYQPEEEEALSAINFKTGYNNVMHDNGSFLSFEKTDDQLPHTSYPRISQQDHDEYSIWEDDTIQSYQHDHQLHPKCSTTSKSGRLFQDFNCVQSTSSYGCGSNTMRENHHGGEPFGWANSEANASTGTIQEFVTLESACFNKRPHQGDRMQDLKRQCTGATRKPKPKTTPSKDPQSIAAKNRRERISERLKVLQELVPNGTKVDLVTMLEKAISYVKFLQLQVKVLATDEFWPVQGGKAPDISQVKEAIDAILSSQKDRNSSSN